MQCALNAFRSRLAVHLTEPFPPDLLKQREMRQEMGNISSMREARDQGQGIEGIKKTDQDNKDIELGLALLQSLPSVGAMIEHCETDTQLREFVNSQTDFEEPYVQKLIEKGR